MFRWCTYCQQLIGEKEPHTDYSVTHGICPFCVEAEVFFDDNDPRLSSQVRFYERLTLAAFKGDLDSAEKLAADAIEMGYDLIDVAVGFLQPALYEIGDKWARHEISHEDEHRFTTWVSHWLELAAPSLQPLKEIPDLLIVQAPGNKHSLGPHLAVLALRKLRFEVRQESRTLTSSQLIALVDKVKPRFLGFSCALSESIPGVLELAGALRAHGIQPPLLLGGVAFRGREPVNAPEGLTIIQTVSQTAEFLKAHGVKPA